MKIVNKNISDLIPAEYNPRTLSTDQREQISASLKRFGFVDPVIVNTHADRKNIIVGGHMRTRVAKEELGLTEVPCVEVELTLDQERELNIRLNKNSGEWDFEALGNYFEIDELTEWGFDPGELDLCLEDEEEPEVEEDDFDEEPPEEPKTELGRIYQLGKHRLMCGDSTSEEDVKRLMYGELADMVFTDPPYGVSYEGGHNTKKRTGIIADTLQGQDLTDLFADALTQACAFTHDYAPFYIWYAGGKSVETYASFGKLDLEVRAVIAWYKVKSGFGAFMAQYIPNYEPCIYAHKVGKSIKWYGPTDEKTVWELKKDAKNEYHPTQKPVELPSRAMNNSSQKGDIILDLFGGSGSTLIAAEQTGRKAHLMELDPKYCDVIVKRYCKLKGIDPEEVFETGVAK